MPYEHSFPLVLMNVWGVFYEVLLGLLPLANLVSTCQFLKQQLQSHTLLQEIVFTCATR